LKIKEVQEGTSSKESRKAKGQQASFLVVVDRIAADMWCGRRGFLMEEGLVGHEKKKSRGGKQGP